MATVQKRGNSYRLIGSCGYDVDGKQVRPTKTWTPRNGMTEKQIKKELERQKVLFDEECLKGLANKKVKFAKFTEQWFKEYAEITLKKQTIESYRYHSHKVNAFFGHLWLDKITPRHIQKFITEMLEAEREDSREGKLTPKTIRNHIGYISSIMSYAVKMGYIANNPCRAVTLPKDFSKEKNIYTLEEVQQILDFLSEEPAEKLQYVVFIVLCIYTGFRRGEILGLEWGDIDFENNIITINRSSYYTHNYGVYTDTPKSKTSYRSVFLPDEVVELIKKHREQQAEYAVSLGDKWQETQRLFTAFDGKDLHPDAPRKYFQRFCKKHNIPFISLHGFRHFNASLQINQGLDIKTVQQSLGHSSASTTLNTYAHAFQSAQSKVLNVISNSLSLKQTPNKHQNTNSD
jgi:integrase